MTTQKIVDGHNTEQRIFQALVRLSSNRGYPPSLKEIAAEAKVASTSSVSSYLERLEAQGLIKRHPKLARSISFSSASAAEQALIESWYQLQCKQPTREQVQGAEFVLRSIARSLGVDFAQVREHVRKILILEQRQEVSV